MTNLHIFKKLKKYSKKSNTKRKNKELINIYEQKITDNCDMILISYHITDDDKYETFISVRYNKSVISRLLYNITDNKNDSIIYFKKLLNEIIYKKDLNILLDALNSL